MKSELSMTLKVNEIFHSIQGESTYAGLACVFVRLTGCNLRCRYCDTRYAYHEGHDLPLTEIIEQVDSFGCNLVEITGGEPLLQENTPILVNRLLAKSYQILMETNGSMDIDRVDSRCIRIMDVKCPSSGEDHQNDWSNLDRLSNNDQIKFVIGDRDDFHFACKTVQRLPNGFPAGHILFSPQYDRLHPEHLAQWMIEARITARMHLQMHKVIWPDRDRGV